MPKITEMFAFVTTDKGPDDEGLVGYATIEGWMPLVGADPSRIESLKPIAQKIAKKTGKPIRILKFSQMEEIGRISPV